LYCEKEGFFAILRSEQWPEHHDCALLTSKGQATRAAKDLLDLLGETAEDLLFFCIHDADAAGTTIYQALQEATRTRPGRRVQVINLGLEPWEAVVMDLPVEDVSYEKRQAVAGYVEAYGAARDEDWAEWLQTHRVELNALSTEAFLRWIDAKLADYDTGKVIPPAHVLEAHYTDEVHQALEDKIREQILVDADLDGRVETAYTELEETITRDTATLPATVASALAGTPVDQWSAPVETLARRRVEEGWS
jgi:hypothetical protein